MRKIRAFLDPAEKRLTEKENVRVLHCKLREDDTKQQKISSCRLSYDSTRITGCVDRRIDVGWAMSDGNLKDRNGQVVLAMPRNVSGTKTQDASEKMHLDILLWESLREEPLEIYKRGAFIR